ncbi:MAG: hypothetical protein AB7O28_01520 [Vicinamibacterales bacterium]
MSRASWARRLAVPAVLVVLAAACGQAPPPAAESPRPSDRGATAWRTLGEWSGRGSRQTESFDVTTGALRLRWEALNAATGAGHLTVTLNSAISGRVLQTIVNHEGNGGASVELQDDPRTSYLEIQSDGLDWRLTLEEAGTRPVRPAAAP